MNKKFAKAVFQKIGIDVAVGYTVFLILALSVSLMSEAGFADDSITLADLLSGGADMAVSSGRGVFLILLATATIGVPYLWRHKLAPLAFVFPLLLTLYGLLPLYERHKAQLQAIEAMGELGQAMGQMAEQLAGSSGDPIDSLGIGAWLLLTIGIFLALKGVMRFLKRA